MIWQLFLSGVGPLWRSRSGATAIEYAMIVLFIALLLIAAFISIGGTVKSFFLEPGTAL